MASSYVQVGDTKVRLYSLEEAANYCGGPTNAVHVQTVIRWRETGWLRSIKVGHSHIYTKELLDEGLRNRQYPERITEEETSGN